MDPASPTPPVGSPAGRFVGGDLLRLAAGGTDPEAALDALAIKLVAQAERMATRYSELLAAERPDRSIVDIFEIHLQRFGDADVADRERLFYLWVAACDRDGPFAQRLHALFDAVYGAFEPVLAEYLAVTHRRPSAPTQLAELPRLVGVLLEGIVLRSRFDPTVNSRAMARAVVRALEAWTEPVPPAAALAPSEEQGIERQVRMLDRRLAVTDVTSPDGLALAIELMAFAPSSTVAFWRIRHRVTPLVAERAIRATPLGSRAWVMAAEIIGMADGNRDIVEEALEVSERLAPDDGAPDALDALRRVWLLLRLERHEEAGAHLAPLRETTFDEERQTLVAAFEAYRRRAVGELDVAVAFGCRAAEGAGFGRGIGAAMAILALLDQGDVARARHVMALAPPLRAPADMGTTMLMLARGVLSAAEGHLTAALDDLLAVPEHLRRVGNRNPSGWPWLRPAVGAMARLGQYDRAAMLVERHAPDAERWGTPYLLIELAKARAELDAAQPLRPPHPALQADGIAAPRTAVLTPRVREVALLASSGLRDREIAERLHLSPRTVHRHVSAALGATGARNRTELARVLGYGDADGDRAADVVAEPPS